MRTWLGLLSWVVGVGLATPAAAFCRLTTESPSSSEDPQPGCSPGIPLAWKQQCISYTVVPSEELGLDLVEVRDTIEASFASWTALRCADDNQPIELGQTEALGQCGTAEYNRYGPNANTVVFARDWTSRGRDFVPEAYALTLVWHNPDTGEIFDADIQVNLNRGPIAICGETCEPQQVDLQNVMTHEAGHFLGLAHSDKETAAMFGNAPVGEVSKRMLSVDDTAGMCDAYHALPEPECRPADFTPRRGFTPDCAQLPEGGACAVQDGRAGSAAAGAGALALVLIALGRRRRAR